MSATFLVTGFEPFGEHRTNSSWDALEHLRPAWPERFLTERLPVDHVRAHQLLRELITRHRPHVVLCTGLAKGHVFRIERLARRPSMLGTALDPEALDGRWPWSEMHAALERAAVDISVSFDAGRYVCESTYWSLLSVEAERAPTFAAFLHVPPVSNEIPLECIARAIASVVSARDAALRGEPESAPAPPPTV
jgi:pyroglutamyl-peptidase